MSAGGPQPVKPVALRREGDGLRIDWADGASTFATFGHTLAGGLAYFDRIERLLGEELVQRLRRKVPRYSLAGQSLEVLRTLFGFSTRPGELSPGREQVARELQRLMDTAT